MMEQQPNPNYTVYSQRSLPVQMDSNFMQMRLDNHNILRKVEFFLSAKRQLLVDQGDGRFKEKIVEKGKPLVNDEGLNGILNIVALRTDPLIIQGNFDTDRFDDYIEMSRKELIFQVIANRLNWGVDVKDTTAIVDNIMAFIEPLMSRTIDNEERNSYGTTMQSVEHMKVDPLENKRKFGLIGK